MATTLTDSAARRPFQPSFFFWMTVVMAFFIFSGFGITYFLPMATGDLTPLPPIVHLHGLFFSAWMILLLAQATLVNVHRVALHRSLGTFGIAIATGVVITGAIIALLFAESVSIDSPAYYDLMYLSIIAVVVFPALFTMAVRQVRAPDNHRRLILFATIPLLPPGINRLYTALFNLNDVPLLAAYLTMDVIAIALLLNDWRTLGKVSGACIVGVATVTIPQLLHVPIVESGAFASLTLMLTELVQYR